MTCRDGARALCRGQPPAACLSDQYVTVVDREPPSSRGCHEGQNLRAVSSTSMAGELTGFLHIVRTDDPVDPVLARYRLTFGPVGGRVRSRYVTCHGLDGLTSFLLQARVSIPEIERAWRTLVTHRALHSIPRVILTPAEIEGLGF